MLGTDQARGVEVVAVRTVADLTGPPASAYDVYLRLHLLSHRLVRPAQRRPDRHLRPPRERRLDQPRSLPGPRASSGRALGCGPADRSRSTRVDKFPRMVDYVMPTGVRIGDADRVRLGAHLA